MTSFPVVWVMMTSSIIHLPSEWVISMKIWSCRKKHYSAWPDVNYHRDDVIAGPGYLEYSWIMQKKRIGIKLWKSTEWLQEKRAGDVIYDWPIAFQRSTQIGICVGVILSLRTNQWWPCKTHATHNTQKEPKVTWVPSRVEFWRHRWVYKIYTRIDFKFVTSSYWVIFPTFGKIFHMDCPRKTFPKKPKKW